MEIEYKSTLISHENGNTDIDSNTIRQTADMEIALMYGEKETLKYEALKISRDAQLHQVARSVPSLIVKKKNVIFPTLHPTQVEDSNQKDSFIWGEALLWNIINSIEFDAPCRGMPAKDFFGKISKVREKLFDFLISFFLGKNGERKYIHRDLFDTHHLLRKELDLVRIKENRKKRILYLCQYMMVLMHALRFLHIVHDIPLPARTEVLREEISVFHVCSNSIEPCLPFILRKCSKGRFCKRKHIMREALKLKRCKLLSSKKGCKYGANCLFDHSFKIWKRKCPESQIPKAPPAPDIEFSIILHLDEPRRSVDTSLFFTPQPKREIALHPDPQFLKIRQDPPFLDDFGQLIEDLSPPLQSKLSSVTLQPKREVVKEWKCYSRNQGSCTKMVLTRAALNENLSRLDVPRVERLMHHLEQVDGDVKKVEDPKDRYFLRVHQLNYTGVLLIREAFEFCGMQQYKKKKRYRVKKKDLKYDFMSSMLYIYHEFLPKHHKFGTNLFLSFWHACCDAGICDEFTPERPNVGEMIVKLMQFYNPKEPCLKF
mmetsp:Transcript_26050/g.34176  ORF Transcript_26050/g.34176 Transcript_26050/m.34176 type:complete len:543 (-) Transcript_26050:946-2574(-)